MSKKPWGITYHYDIFGRLKRYVERNPSGRVHTMVFTYDRRGRLRRYRGTAETWRLTYGRYGRGKGRVIRMHGKVGGAGRMSISYTYGKRFPRLTGRPPWVFAGEVLFGAKKARITSRYNFRTSRATLFLGTHSDGRLKSYRTYGYGDTYHFVYDCRRVPR